MEGPTTQPFGVVYLPKSLYERAKRDGFDMHGYAPQELMPLPTTSHTIPVRHFGAEDFL